MSNYELDQNNFLNYTGDGWQCTTRPLTKEEIDLFNEGELNYKNFEWEDCL